jgi:hypothetical protein
VHCPLIQPLGPFSKPFSAIADNTAAAITAAIATAASIAAAIATSSAVIA